VTYLPGVHLKTGDFWIILKEAGLVIPELWKRLRAGCDATPQEVCAAAELARQVRLRDLSHLHAHFATSATTVARLAAHFAGITYSFTAHAKDIFHDSVCEKDLRRKLHDARATITVSDYNRTNLSDRFRDQPNRITRIYNGIDLEQFSYSAPAESEPVILAVGRLVEKKGFPDLIDACAHLEDRGRPFSCRIIGGGEDDAELRARITRLGLSESVHLLGPRPQPEVIAELRRAAVFAAPCVVGSDGNRDGLPTVLLEAMALGTPCISTDVTGIPEAIVHGRTGWIVPQHDPVALADALARLLDDPSLRRDLSRAARAHIERHFDIEKNAVLIRSVFDRCIEQARPRSRRVHGAGVPA